MRTRFLSGLVTIALIAVVGWAQPASAVTNNCAFRDDNDNGIQDGVEPTILNTAWVGTTGNFAAPFVIPAGCVIQPASAPGLSRVNARKISIFGQVIFNFKSSAGVVFDANPAAVGGAVGDGSIIVDQGHILAGGNSANLFPNAAGFEAVFNRSITLFARGDAGSGGTCEFTSADIRTTVPEGINAIGVHCLGDATIKASTFVAARINIQSLTGKIDGSATSGPLSFLGNLCDNPGTNLAGNGNNNGVIDPPDFPCQLNLGAQFPGVTSFADAAALAAFCTIAPPGGVNHFLAKNDPLLILAQGLLDLRGVDITNRTELQGRYRVTLGSVTNNVLLDNTDIGHVTLPAPGGAKIQLSAGAPTVVRLPNDHEDFLGVTPPVIVGPGQITVQNACIKHSTLRIFVTNGDTLVGVPDATCTVIPGDFQFVEDIIN